VSQAETARRLVDARRVAGALLSELAPACLRIEIAGSIRREKPWISDIELLAIPQLGEAGEAPAPAQASLFGDPSPATAPLPAVNLLWERIEEISEQHTRIIPIKPSVAGEEPDARWGEKRAAGSKYFKLWLPRAGLKVDLFMADRDTWGVLFAIRTGSADFSKALVTRWTHVSGGGHSTGARLLGADGQPVSTPEEEDVFLHCQTLWIPPSARNGAADIKGI
jgi:DNA polymerase/3'-5' exonuclease PolX